MINNNVKELLYEDNMKDFIIRHLTQYLAHSDYLLRAMYLGLGDVQGLQTLPGFPCAALAADRELSTWLLHKVV